VTDWAVIAKLMVGMTALVAFVSGLAWLYRRGAEARYRQGVVYGRETAAEGLEAAIKRMYGLPGSADDYSGVREPGMWPASPEPGTAVLLDTLARNDAGERIERDGTVPDDPRSIRVR
jgi:hypothetical protein